MLAAYIQSGCFAAVKITDISSSSARLISTLLDRQAGE
jgi:hypothetical protein